MVFTGSKNLVKPEVILEAPALNNWRLALNASSKPSASAKDLPKDSSVLKASPVCLKVWPTVKDKNSYLKSGGISPSNI